MFLDDLGMEKELVRLELLETLSMCVITAEKRSSGNEGALSTCKDQKIIIENPCQIQGNK